MDGRHFAEEFVRRKKLADKGVVEKQPIPSAARDGRGGGTGGWSEVAKKGSNNNNKEESSIPGASSFKVVPSRKKGRK
jgi:PERQ amino acid-rich with GYF domain-containing protein